MTGSPRRVMIVEDEAELARLLADYLRRDGFETEIVSDGDQAMAALRRGVPDMVLLDVMLPGLNGIEVLRELRKTSNVPVILATARVEEIDRLIGLELGADDYVCKPYSPREVVARVRTVLRRARLAGAPDPRRRLEIDKLSRQVRVSGSTIELTPKEFKLLEVLSARPGRVFSRSQLLDLVGEDNLDVSDRSIDSHVKNLRRKLGQAVSGEEVIRSVYGMGYVFEP